MVREFAVTSIRLIAVEQGRVIPANNWGKAKTVSQIVAICIVLLTQYILDLGAYGILALPTETLSPIFTWVNFVVMAIATLLAVVSGLHYPFGRTLAFPMKITVIGCGRWGTFIAWYLDKIGHSVSLYGRKSSAHMQKLIETRTNGLVELPETLHLTNSLDAVKDSDVIVISVNSQGLRGLMRELQPFELKNKIFVLCMKGVEIETGMRLSQVCAAECDSSNAVAVWVGPGHVQEFAAGVPNCMVIDSDSEDAKKTLVESFGSDLIRFYYGQDLIGNEIGAAAKNVVGIAAGMLDGLGLSTLKGALMARGTREIARLIDALGGNELSAYGLCHLGDYEATLFSPYSHNRMFGEKFVKNEPYTDLAEGYYAVDALLRLGKMVSADLPICRAVYNVLYKGENAHDEVNALFTRSIKNEF